MKNNMKADRTVWSASTQSHDCICASVCKKDSWSSIKLFQVGHRKGLSEASTSCDLWTSHPCYVMIQPDLIPCRMMLWRESLCTVHCRYEFTDGREGGRHLSYSTKAAHNFPALLSPVCHYIHITHVEHLMYVKSLSIKLLSLLSVDHLEKQMHEHIKMYSCIMWIQ